MFNKNMATLMLLVTMSFLHSSAHAEQTKYGKVKILDIVNYGQGAIYVHLEGASFTECSGGNTIWCAIDLDLVSANQMYSAVLAAKMADKEVGVTTNACWSNGKWPAVLESSYS